MSATESEIEQVIAKEMGRLESTNRDQGEKAVQPLKFTLAGDITLEPKLFLIDGFVGQYEQSAWFGPPDAGKSAVMIDVACHIAAGLEYCGRTVERGAVLYVACERGAVVKRRIKAWCLEHHDRPDIPLAVIDDTVDLRTNKVDANRIIAAALQHAEQIGLPVVLIVIDTMNRALAGGDENGPKDMGAFIAALDRIYRTVKCHVSVVHHTPADRTDRMRGHTSATAAFDLTVSITRSNGAVVVAVEKGNDLVEKPEFRFEFKSVPLPVEPETTAPVLVPISQGTVKAAARKPKLLSKAGKIALRALQEALDQAGVLNGPGSDHIPSGVRVTTKDVWRRYAYQAGISEGDSPDAKKKAFKRGYEAVISDGFALAWGEQIWMPKKGEAA